MAAAIFSLCSSLFGFPLFADPPFLCAAAILASLRDLLHLTSRFTYALAKRWLIIWISLGGIQSVSTSLSKLRFIRMSFRLASNEALDFSLEGFFTMRANRFAKLPRLALQLCTPNMPAPASCKCFSSGAIDTCSNAHILFLGDLVSDHVDNVVAIRTTLALFESGLDHEAILTHLQKKYTTFSLTGSIT